MLKNLKLFSVITLFPVFLLFSSCAKNANAKQQDLEMATISMDHITQCWPAVASAVSEMEAYQALIKQYISNEEIRLQKKGEELQHQKNILTNEIFQKEVQKYKNQFDGFNQKREKYSLLLDRCKSSVMERFQSSIVSFTKDIGQDLKIDVVLPSSVVLYNSGKMRDISNDVCAIIKKKAKSKLDVRSICSEIIEGLDMKQLYFPTDKEVKKYQDSKK